jgi:hypothetical protein
MSTRGDADNDSRCVGTAVNECIGAAPPAGRRLTNTCATSDDCNDNNASVFQWLTVRVDADGDSYCTGSAFQACSGNSPPAMLRLATSCQATDDCDDANASSFLVVSTRADPDADGYCTGTAASSCTNGAAPPGRRLTSMCQLESDCAENDATRFRVVSLRDDQDNDTWCVGQPTPTCIGNTIPQGKRMTSQCVMSGDDCKDNNVHANYRCVIPFGEGYLTSWATKQCGIGHPPSQSFSVTQVQGCPPGFLYFYGLTPTDTQYSGDQGGVCMAQAGTLLSMTCNNLVFGTFTCRIRGECIAN